MCHIVVVSDFDNGYNTTLIIHYTTIKVDTLPATCIYNFPFSIDFSFQS